jgi:hypothetical protein
MTKNGTKQRAVSGLLATACIQNLLTHFRTVIFCIERQRHLLIAELVQRAVASGSLETLLKQTEFVHGCHVTCSCLGTPFYDVSFLTATAVAVTVVSVMFINSSLFPSSELGEVAGFHAPSHVVLFCNVRCKCHQSFAAANNSSGSSRQQKLCIVQCVDVVARLTYAVCLCSTLL